MGRATTRPASAPVTRGIQNRALPPHARRLKPANGAHPRRETPQRGERQRLKTLCDPPTCDRRRRVYRVLYGNRTCRKHAVGSIRAAANLAVVYCHVPRVHQISKEMQTNCTKDREEYVGYPRNTVIHEGRGEYTGHERRWDRPWPASQQRKPHSRR